MDALSELGRWITTNESLLSGLVAMVVLVGLVVSPLGARVRRMLGAAKAAEGASPRKAITLDDLTRPGPEPVRFADADGVRIAYTVRGQGPPISSSHPGSSRTNT